MFENWVFAAPLEYQISFPKVVIDNGRRRDQNEIQVQQDLLLEDDYLIDKGTPFLRPLTIKRTPPHLQGSEGSSKFRADNFLKSSRSIFFPKNLHIPVKGIKIGIE